MTFNVSSGTLNPTIPYNTIWICFKWGLKMPIHTPKMDCFGNFTPIWEEFRRAPEGTSHHMTYRSWKQIHWCEFCVIQKLRWRRYTNKLKIWQVTFSPRPPTLLQRQTNLHVYPWHSYIFHVSSKSGFWSHQVKIWPFPLLWLLAFTPFVLPCKPW